jgi:hypothetical protein
MEGILVEVGREVVAGDLVEEGMVAGDLGGPGEVVEAGTVAGTAEAGTAEADSGAVELEEMDLGVVEVEVEMAGAGDPEGPGGVLEVWAGVAGVSEGVLEGVLVKGATGDTPVLMGNLVEGRIPAEEGIHWRSPH